MDNSQTLENPETPALNGAPQKPMKTVNRAKSKIGGRRGGITTALLLLPYLLSFLIFIVLPVLLAIILSFTDSTV